MYMFLAAPRAGGRCSSLPVVIFGVLHIKNARNRPNRRAVRAGYALFTATLLLIVSGVVLTRLEGVIVVQDPTVRNDRLVGPRAAADRVRLDLRAAPPGGQARSSGASGGAGRPWRASSPC